MPECPEITIFSHFLKIRLTNSFISEPIKALSGKYLNMEIHGNNLINKVYNISEICSKGKLLYIKMDSSTSLNDTIYIVTHLGLHGNWSFNESAKDRLRLCISAANGEQLKLCYTDSLNYGTVEILTEKEFQTKLDNLAPDVLKTNFTNEEFIQMVKQFMAKSKSRSKQQIFKILTKQNTSDGIFSGLGNYLIPEILYMAKLSPYREIGSFTVDMLNTLAYSIKYITKLAYYGNTTKYTKQLGNFLDLHKQMINNGEFPNYHSDIILKSTDVFEFNVYQKDVDKFNNPVEKDKLLNKGRTTHWVKNIQV